ncbi:alpha/beta fold hydrolase [Aldersonia kunmingensis]|uniref:alpha/beta fold hydrolase n=1 Tax=Aldersonia kunmingensis TaxID=408066 RepID=UPI000B165020|nr:alpha/beta fold hydrolase [Aldersonia kunmingensis]
MRLDTPYGSVECGVSGVGTPVLVLHGSPGGIDSAEIMARFLPRDRFRVITVSRPGYLGTPLSVDRTIDAEANRHAALLDALDVPAAGVLAWSGGGPAAFRLAARHPDRVRGLVAVAPVTSRQHLSPPGLVERALFATPAGSWVVAAMERVIPRQIVAGAVDSQGTLAANRADERVNEIMADPEKRRFVLDITRTVGRGGRRKAGWDNDAVQFSNIESLNFGAIAARTLVVASSHDAEIAAADCVDAAAAIPQGELLMLDYATHLDFYTHPDSAAAQAKAMEVLTAED